MNNTKLPDKLSDLIELAISDLEKCEASPDYVINMMEWHTPQEDGTCAVCLAGSVMAQTLGVDKTNIMLPIRRIFDKLDILDDVRDYDIQRAFGTMGLTCELRMLNLPYPLKPQYKDDPQQFKENMRYIIEQLRKQGL